MQPPKKDTEEYYKYWEDRGYEFVEGRTVDSKTGNTKFIWIKRKKRNLLKDF
jgi:hypothetical protein